MMATTVIFTFVCIYTSTLIYLLKKKYMDFLIGS
ncbi:hypothetical protein CsSME_00034871 [Camellia sinensis var. sinensis]